MAGFFTGLSSTWSQDVLSVKRSADLLLAAGGVDAIPVRALELQAERIDGQLQARKLLASNERKGANGMAENPGIDDGGGVRPVFPGQFQQLVPRGGAMRILLVPEEPTAGQGRPDHGMNPVRAEVVHHAGAKMLEADGVPLDLVGDETAADSLLERVKFERIEVGHADIPDEALFLQIEQCACRLPGIQKRIFTVDQVEIKAVAMKPLETLAAGAHDALVAGVVIPEHAVVRRHLEDAGLGDELDFLTQLRRPLERETHLTLALGIGVNFRRVEGGDAEFNARLHEIDKLIRGEVPVGQTPKALNDSGKSVLIADFYALHDVLLLIRGGVLAHVHGDSRDNNETLDDKLPVGVQTDVGQAIGDNGEDEHAAQTDEAGLDDEAGNRDERNVDAGGFRGDGIAAAGIDIHGLAEQKPHEERQQQRHNEHPFNTGQQLDHNETDEIIAYTTLVSCL